jgi:dihydrodipicolinate synthase/N-acetylneuraminate lyase
MASSDEHREHSPLPPRGNISLISDIPKFCADNRLLSLKVADASPIPVMIYNFPVVTAGQDLNSDVIALLAEHPNIVGTKLSCGNIGKLHRLTTRFAPSEFAVFAGRTDVFLQGLLSGSAGAIAALVNVLPKLHGQLYKLHQEGKIDEAMKLQGKLCHGDWASGRIGGIAGLKAIILTNFGYGEKFVRGPLTAINPESLPTSKYYGVIEELIAMEKAL